MSGFTHTKKAIMSHAWIWIPFVFLCSILLILEFLPWFVSLPIVGVIGFLVVNKLQKKDVVVKKVNVEAAAKAAKSIEEELLREEEEANRRKEAKAAKKTQKKLQRLKEAEHATKKFDAKRKIGEDDIDISYLTKSTKATKGASNIDLSEPATPTVTKKKSKPSAAPVSNDGWDVVE